MKDWKRALTLTIALALTVCLGVTARAAGDSPFEDVDSSAWYSADVTAVYQTGLFNGTSDTSFDPEGTLSLAQSAALAARLHQYAHSGAVTLQNGTDQWYSTYVDYAKQNGIISGEYDGRWSETATRAEMVKILYHALDADSYTAINTVEDNAIPDVKTGWAACDEIYAFYRAGILAGGEGNKFNSKSTIQRCEVAAILNRMLDPERRQSVTLTLPELPDPGDTNITAEKVFAILDRLDPDGAFIFHTTGNIARSGYTSDSYAYVAASGGNGNGSEFLTWWPETSRHMGADGEDEYTPTWLVEGFDRAVHEETHIFYHNIGYYIGNGEYLPVMYTQVFDSLEMAKTLPEELHGYNYDTYISENALAGGRVVASRASGIYGLLNEWVAYYWEAHNDWMLKDYDTLREDSVTITNSSWSERGPNGVSGGSSSVIRYYLRLSQGPSTYANFRYYMLKYMLYAKEHYPDIYQGILDNDNFRQVFTEFDERFGNLAANIKEWNKSISSTDIHSRSYDTFMTEMEKPEYQEMLSLLKP